MMTLAPVPVRAPGDGSGVPGLQPPQPSRSRTVATKYTADFPHPVQGTNALAISSLVCAFLQ
ncbi:MAG: hypothetical protein ACFNKE_07470, partial [Neisseria elongata]